MNERHGPLTHYQTAAAGYRERYGWATFAVDTIVWATPGYGIEALNVPRELGRRALTILHNGGTPVPVIEIPGPSARWVFLMRPWPAPPEPTPRRFAGHDIGYAHAASTTSWSLDLPPTQHPGHDPLTWIATPDITPPPPTLVVDAIARALGDQPAATGSAAGSSDS